MQVMPTSKQLSKVVLAVIAPYLSDLITDITDDAEGIRREFQDSEPETLLTQLSDVTQELLELVEVLAGRPLTQVQLQILRRLEVAANNAMFQARDLCESFKL